ncbi:MULTISPECIES: glycosyltransferase [unclassified Streptomyces]|uniref:glycosyltransferase n=1 Tax=unclassified Streptomyces TaxID=2593676 RepID=UPI003679BE63
MRVLLMAYGSRGDIAPLAGLAAQLRHHGAEVRVCAPPDEEFAELVAGVGAELVPFGRDVRALRTGAPPSDAAAFAAELVAAHFDTVARAAEDCDVLVASGLMPAGARSVAEKRGIRYVYAGFHPFEMPSAHYRPSSRPGPPAPPGMTDNQALWDLDAQKVDALYLRPLNAHRAAIGLAPVVNVRDHVFTERPWLAVDPVLGPWQEITNLDLVQTGAWILPDARPLPAGLEAFLDAGTPPVYVGFGSMPMSTATDLARITVEAARAQGRRVLVSRGWAGLGPVDGSDDCLAVGDVNHQALFRRVAAVVHHGGAGTTTTAAKAGAPQVVVPQFVDQPHWAARVAELGIGAAHDGPTPTFDSLSAALGTVLTAGTEARAKAVAATIRTDGAAVAAKLLLGTGRLPLPGPAPDTGRTGRPGDRT